MDHFQTMPRMTAITCGSGKFVVVFVEVDNGITIMHYFLLHMMHMFLFYSYHIHHQLIHHSFKSFNVEVMDRWRNPQIATS